MAKGTLNKVILIGRLGLDPEVRYMPGGSPVATLSLATNESYKDKSGQWVERTEWHRIVFMGDKAKVVAEARKGTLLYVEGRIRTNKWKDAAGNDRYMTEIFGNEMQFLGSRAENASKTASFDGAQGGAGNNKKPNSAENNEKSMADYSEELMPSSVLSPVPEMHASFVGDDDIPF